MNGNGCEGDCKIESEATGTRPGGAVSATGVLPWMLRIEDHPNWEVISQVRMQMRAEAAFGDFTVRDLLTLAEGQVFVTRLPASEDVPIKIDSVQLGWSEFEVVEQRMALRVTRLE